MADILLCNPHGAYDGNAPEAEEYIECYKDKSARAIEFTYNTDVAADGSGMVIKKGIIDLVRCILPSNVWNKNLFESTGDAKPLKDVTIHAIIQSIQTESIKPGYQYTNTGLLKRQIAPQWSEGIRTYIEAITKNEYDITNMGFMTDYTVLFHHLKFHLKKFDQTP